MIKYDTTLVTFTEVPDEISLCLNITGCPCRCKECFEPWLQKDYGTELTFEETRKLLDKNPHVSCLCFMGGDRDHQYIKELIIRLKPWYPKLKFAMYSGLSLFDPDLAEMLDYYKFGPFIPEYGPLNKETTNQKFCAKVNGVWKDQTKLFQKKKV